MPLPQTTMHPTHRSWNINTLRYFQIGRDVIRRSKRSIEYRILSLTYVQKNSPQVYFLMAGYRFVTIPVLDPFLSC